MEENAGRGIAPPNMKAGNLAQEVLLFHLHLLHIFSADRQNGSSFQMLPSHPVKSVVSETNPQSCATRYLTDGELIFSLQILFLLFI